MLYTGIADFFLSVKFDTDMYGRGYPYQSTYQPLPRYQPHGQFFGAQRMHEAPQTTYSNSNGKRFICLYLDNDS